MKEMNKQVYKFIAAFALVIGLIAASTYYARAATIIDVGTMSVSYNNNVVNTSTDMVNKTGISQPVYKYDLKINDSVKINVSNVMIDGYAISDIEYSMSLYDVNGNKKGTINTAVQSNGVVNNRNSYFIQAAFILPPDLPAGYYYPVFSANYKAGQIVNGEAASTVPSIVKGPMFYAMGPANVPSTSNQPNNYTNYYSNGNTMTFVDASGNKTTVPGDVRTHTVTYVSEGSVVKVEKVIADANCHVSATPTNLVDRTGTGYYEFAGWYYNDKCSQSYEFDPSKVIEDDLTLYAKWIVKSTGDTKCYILEVKDYGIMDYKAYMASGAVPTEFLGVIPKKKGYSFLGWFEDGSNIPFDFSKPLLKDTVVRAKWSAVNYCTVTFNTMMGPNSSYSSQVIVGTPVSRPVDPVMNGYTFTGWKNSNTLLAYDFNTPVTGDITLVATWQVSPSVQTQQQIQQLTLVSQPLQQTTVSQTYNAATNANANTVNTNASNVTGNSMTAQQVQQLVLNNQQPQQNAQVQQQPVTNQSTPANTNNTVKPSAPANSVQPLAATDTTTITYQVNADGTVTEAGGGTYNTPKTADFFDERYLLGLGLMLLGAALIVLNRYNTMKLQELVVETNDRLLKKAESLRKTQEGIDVFKIRFSDKENKIEDLF